MRVTDADSSATLRTIPLRPSFPRLATDACPVRRESSALHSGGLTSRCPPRPVMPPARNPRGIQMRGRTKRAPGDGPANAAASRGRIGMPRSAVIPAQAESDASRADGLTSLDPHLRRDDGDASHGPERGAGVRVRAHSAAERCGQAPVLQAGRPARSAAFRQRCAQHAHSMLRSPCHDPTRQAPQARSPD